MLLFYVAIALQFYHQFVSLLPQRYTMQDLSVAVGIHTI